MRHIILPCVTPLTRPHFSTLSHKRHDFRIAITERKLCVVIFSTRIKRDITINLYSSSYKAPVILVRF
jgi:hypothetical protein